MLASAPSPTAVITIGDAVTPLISSQACFTVDISNSGTETGFGPYYRLILPPHLTLASASFLGLAITPEVLGVFPASPGNQVADTRASNASVTGTEGDSLTNLVLPLGSISQNGPTLTTNICVDVSTSAVSETALDVSLQPVLEYGNTATGDNGAIDGSKVTAQITPIVMTYDTSNDAPAGKQVPGTTFGLTYSHVIDVADTKPVSTVSLDETFSSDLTFDQFNPATPTGGTGCVYGAAPGTNMSMTCTSILGLASATDVSTGYDAHINDILDEGTCANQDITHNSTLDASGVTQQTINNSVISARHLTLIKSLSPATLNPGDTITVSGTIRVSDFATASSLSFVDQIPDGLTYVSHSALTVNGGSVTITPVAADTGGGTSTLTYNLTAVAGNITAGSLINYSYTVTVDTDYDASPVLASDIFTIDGTATYSLTAGASACTDTHSDSVTLTAVTYSSEILNPPGGGEYYPGDVVTFRLTMTVPSGDTDNIVFKEYFPLPVFDVSTMDTTFFTTPDAGAVTGVVRSATDTIASTPTSITVDPGTNSLNINWPDISTASTQTLSVDVVMTITDEPFPDNLSLTSLFSGASSNSPAVVNSDINPVKMLVRNASLSIVSGISAISENGTLSAPASDPAESDANGVDAGDTMTQTITITNDGGSAAYNINVNQPDLTDLSGYTLTAATINGVDITATGTNKLTGSLSTTLVVNSDTSILAGEVMALTYTYQIDQTALVAGLLQPQAGVVWSASDGATPFTEVQASLDINLDDISIVATATVAPEGNTGKLVVGDVVTYQVAVTLPEGTVTDLVVDFVLPTGLEYVNASSAVDTGSHTGTIVGVTEATTGVVATGQTIKFTFTGDSTTTNNNNTGDNTFTITLDALVKDDAANAATSSEQSKTLNVNATYDAVTSNPSDTDIQAFTEHLLSMTSTVAPSSGLQAGDSVTVTIVVTNNGTAPAYNVAVSELVATSLFDLTTVSTGTAGCGYANPNFTCAFDSIAASGGTETVSYTGTVKADVATGAAFSLDSTVTGDSQDVVTGDERSQGDTAYGATTTQALAISGLTVIATSETFTPDPSGGVEPLAIGETVTYELVITVPEGVSSQTGSNDFVSFTLPAGLQYISSSALIRSVIDSTMSSVTLAGNISTSDTAIVPTVDDAGSITGQSLTFDLGNVTNNDDDAGEEQIIVTITALVLNTDANTSGHSLVTTGAVNYLNEAAAPQTASANHSSKVLQPDLALTHTATPATVEGSDVVTYTLTATNTASANSTNGYDWAISGTAPAILTSPAITSVALARGGNVDISACAGFTGNVLSIDGSCLDGGGQNGTEHYLAPGETITVEYQATVDVSVGFEQTIANTMKVTATSLSGNNGAAAPGAAGSDTGERIGDNSNNTSAQAVNDLVVSTTANVVSGAPSLSLTASATQATILSEVTLTASFSVPVGTNNNFVLSLDLPTGLSYQNEAIVITEPGSNFTTSLSPSTTPGANTDPLVLDFGTITNSAGTAQALSVAVKVVVDNLIANQDGSTLSSAASLSYTGVVSAPTDTAVVTVIEANLTMTQLITAGNAGSDDAGDTISYQVTVNNSGTNATAYQVNLSDLLPPELLGGPDGAGAGPIFTNISVTNPGDVIVLSGTTTPLDATHNSISTTTNTNDTLTHTAFDLPPGITLTYSYDVMVANSAAVGASVVNNTRVDYSSVATGTGRSGSASNDDDNDATLDNYYETDSSTLTLGSSIALQHNLTSGQADANFAIGETVSMDARVDILQGTTNSINLTQVLDSGLTFVSASVVADGHISYNGAGTATESPTGTISVDLGNVSNSADADTTNDYITWRVLARVNDDNANVTSTALNGNASATSAVGNAGPQTLAVTVVEPNLVTTITPSSATTSLGGEVTFTVLVAHNTSGADAFDTVLNLVIPSGLTYVASSFSGQGNLDDSDTSLLNVSLSSIALADTSKTFSFRAKVDNTATASSVLTVSLSNSSSYSATSGTTTDDRDYSLTATGSTTVSTANFIDATQSVTIVDDNGNDVANGGETLQYTIVLTNNGTTASNVTYNEIIPTSTTLVSSSLTSTAGGVTETSGTDLLVTVGTMNNGDVVTVTYQVVIDAGIAAGSEIIAQGYVDSDQTISELSDSDGNEANGDQPQITHVGGQPTVLDGLYVQQLADWTTDYDNDSNVSPGDTITMSYFIENRGDSQLNDVSVTDTIVSGLTYVASSATTASGTIDVTGSAITIDLTSLNSGEQVVATVTLTIDNPLFNNDGDANAETFVMQANISSNETSASLSDQNGIIADGNQSTSVSAVTGGGGSAAPEVVQQWSLTNDVDSDGLVDAGDEVTYWLTVINNGSVAATNVILDEVIPTNTTLVTGSVSSSQGLVITESPMSVNLLDISPSQLVSLSYEVIVGSGTADGTVISAQADLSGDTFTSVQSDDNGQSSDGINPTLFTVNNGATSTLGATLVLSASSDAGTTGNNYIQGETLTLQASFTLPAGTTDDLVLKVDIPTGLAYQAGSAALSRTFDTGLTATHNPAIINSTASGTAVNIDSLLTTDGNNIALVLGTVVNSDNDANAELYQLNLTLTSTSSIATASSNDLLANAVASFLDNLNQTQTSQSPNLTLTLLNRKPVAADDSDNTDEDTAITLTLMDNDTDLDNGQTLSITATTTPANGGTVVIASDANSVTFTPAQDNVGSDNFNYTLTDSAGGTHSATATITVNAQPDAPVAVNDTATVVEDSSDNSITVLDNDTDADGDDLTVTTVTASNGAISINGDSTLNYTPNANFNGADTISYSISDGNGGSDNAVVTITVTSINDAPIATDDSISASQDSLITIISVLDNDSDAEGDTLVVIAATSSNGVVNVNDDGSLSYTANKGFSGTDTISYSISDGNGGTSDAMVTVTIEQQNIAPIAVDDSYTFAYQPTLDLDVLSNDLASEGDTISLSAASSEFGHIEISGDRLLFSPEAQATGSFVLTYSIVNTSNQSASAQVFITLTSDQAPVITLPADLCEANSVNAEALYTRINLGEASAVDQYGNTLPVSLTDGISFFPPGISEVFWQATDADGNTSVAMQKVCVMPLISIEKDQTLSEGESASVGIYLNGPSPSYPVVIAYQVAGSADVDDHDLISGELLIESGTENHIKFTINADDDTELDDIITITLVGDINLGSKFSHISVITEENIAPKVSLHASQGDQLRHTVSKTDGLVEVTAGVYDPNPDDTLSYYWYSDNVSLIDQSSHSAEFVFNPETLAVGVYQIYLEVADDGEPTKTDKASIYIEVVESLVELTDADSDGDLIPDNIEGYADVDGDGIPDYLDRIDECNVLQEEALVYDGYLIEGQSGVCLRRGDFTIGGQTGGAHITNDDIEEGANSGVIPDPNAINIGGIFDYIAYGMPDIGQSFAIVMPQRKPIPINAVYRKYREDSGWGFFIENAQNTLWSTQGEPGYCPPPNSSDDNNVWSPGLTEGHWCVQQIIKDGGINDDDDEVNGTIIDPGGVSVMLTSNHLPVAVDDVVEINLNAEKSIDVLTNDTDEDGDLLTITSATATIGNVSIIDGQLYYISANDYDGDIIINYGISDNNGGTDHAIVTITVLRNEPSVVVNATTKGGGSLSFWMIIMLLTVMVSRLYKRVGSKMNIRNFTAVIGVFLFPLAHAGDQDCQGKNTNYKHCDTQIGWYIGGQLGYAQTDISQSDLDTFYDNTGFQANSIDIDDSDYAFSLMAGYQYNTYWALEGSYINLGKRSVDFSGSTEDLDAFYNNVEHIYLQSASGLSVAVVGSWPVYEDFKLSGKLGYWHWKGDYSTYDANNAVGSDTIKGNDLWFGAELNYRLNEPTQLYLSAERFNLDRDTNNVFSLGVRYYFDGSSSATVTPAPAIIPTIDSTPEKVAVIVTPPKDDDKDGVLDTQDACVNSNPLHQVDATGCTVMEKQEFNFSLTIHYANDSSDIPSSYDDKLQVLADFINEYNVKQLNVYGHTSAPGSRSYNQRLSQKRAESVSKALVEQFNINSQIIKAIGQGETELNNKENTEAAHNANRRIELNITELLLLPVKKQ